MEASTNWEQLFGDALAKRLDLLAQPDTDCLRLFHGYGEGYPGLVVEKFGSLAIVDHKKPLDSDLDTIINCIEQVNGVDIIATKAHQSLGQSFKQRFNVARGQLPPSGFHCTEAGVKFNIQPSTPHNLGLYLDAREARSWLRDNSSGRRILNLFAFTGSLGVSAMLGGAREVVHLDKSANLLSRITANYELNNLKWDPRSFLKGDIYKHLPRAHKAGQRFEGIILDPPPKVYASRYAENKPTGQDFQQLVTLCSRLLVPGGWLMCFFHRFDQTRKQFEQHVLDNSEIPLTIEHRMTSGIDFPETLSENKLRISIFKA